jgi:transcriptional regulator with XRE-family HTH domain
MTGQESTRLEREIAIALGDRIRALRRSAGLTQEALAERVAISWKHFQDIETARNSNPTLKTLVGIAAALDVSVVELLDGIVPEPRR